MKYAFVQWNRDRHPQMYDYIDKIKSGESVEETWLFHEKAINIGDRVFVYSSEENSRGFIAAGHAMTERYIDEENCAVVRIKFDAIPDFRKGVFLSLNKINEICPGLAQHSSSGRMIPKDKEYDFELAWAKTIGVKNDAYNLLKVSPDIIPDKHDGSYELVRETVKSYTGLNDLNSVTFADIDLIYLMAIIQTDKKRNSECIDKSSLPDSEKERLHSVLDNVWKRASNHEYENIAKLPLSIGMFGTEFYTFNKPTSDPDLPVIVIKALVNIYNNIDAQTIYRNLKNDIGNQIKGISVPSFSVMAHCLKPNIFPIINKNEGFENIFETLGIALHRQNNISNYVDCCIAISNYKNANFDFNNYRVMDLVARNMISIDYIKVLEYCENNVNLQYEDPKNVTDPNRKAELIKIKENGQEATDIMKQMCVACSNLYNLKLCGQVKWLDGSNKKTRDYLWARLRYQGYEEDAESISIKCQRSDNNKYEFSFEVEVDNEKVKHDHSLLDRHHKLLNIPMKADDKLVYIRGTNELKNVASITETVDDLKAKLNSGQIDKVKVARVIKHESNYSNKDYYDAMVQGVGALIPYYEHIIGVNNGTNAVNGNSNNLNKKVQTIMKNNIVGLNTILYGPPGTGKTYNSKAYAVAICNYNGDLDAVKDLDYKNDIIPAYDKLVEEGRVAFTTFHQSYGYEEFIEGIKPVLKDDDSKEVYYDVIPGLFKKFCDDALISEQNMASIGIDENAPIWKMSLYGGKTDILQECFDEDYLRIGFDKNSGNNSLKLFKEEMHAGDIVLSLESFYEINGIAQIIDENVTELNKKTEFKIARKVKWLFKNKVINIKDINGGNRLPIKTCSGLPNMNRAEVFKLINEETGTTSNVEKKPRVFIIDEINRGNISKIFGELITLIEASKRKGADEAMSCILPYSNQKFSVPNNVYILGTMNTADRSIALMDTALRRRFDFIEMMPDYEVDFMQNLKVGNIDIVKMLRAMNDRIEVLYDREHTLGHAFFKDVKTIDDLGLVFENKIIPLLQEYFFEDYERISLVLGDNAKTDKNFKFIITDNINANIFRNGDIPDSIVDKRVSKLNLKEAIKHEESYIQIYE